MSKVERLFELVNLIRAHQPITAAQLAEKLGVSVRSVYRYVNDISSTIPIYGEAGVGYSLSKGFELPPLMLTDDEMDALLLSIEMLSMTTGVRLPRAANSLLHKIQAALPLDDGGKKATHLHAVMFYNREKTALLWDQLWNAIQQRIILEIDYLSLQDKSSKRKIQPLGLFYWGEKWTMATWCLLRSEFRSFRMDRIIKISDTSEHFELTDQVNLKAFLANQQARNNCLVATEKNDV